MSPSEDTASRIRELRLLWESDRTSKVYLQLAEELRRSGELSEAIDVLEKSLEHRPRDPRGRVSLARCRLDQGRADLAADLLEEVTRIDPAHEVACKLLLETYLQLGDVEKASARLGIYRLLNDRDPELDHLEFRLERLKAETPSDRPSGASEAPPSDPTPTERVAILVDEVSRSEAEAEPEAAGSDFESPDALLEEAISSAGLDVPPVAGLDSAADPDPAAGGEASAEEIPVEVDGDFRVEDVFELEPDPAAVRDDSPLVAASTSPGESGDDLFDLGPPPAAPSLDDLFDLRSASSAPAPSLDDLWAQAATPEIEAEPREEIEAEPVIEASDTVEPSEVTVEPSEVIAAADAAVAQAISLAEAVGVETPLEEATLEEASAEEAPLEEAPLEEAPVEEAAAEEAPLDDPAEAAAELATPTLGHLYLRQGHLDEARRIFDEVLARDPENAAALDGADQVAKALEAESPVDTAEDSVVGESAVEESAVEESAVEEPAAEESAAEESAAVASADSLEEDALAARLLADPSIGDRVPEGLTAKKVLILEQYLERIRASAARLGAVDSGAVENGAVDSGAVENGAVENGAIENHVR